MRTWALLLLGTMAAMLVAAEARAKAPRERTFLVEAPLIGSATPASSGVETSLLFSPGLRGGMTFPFGDPLFVGADVTLSGTWENAGTKPVGVTRILGGLEARGLVGTSFGGRFARILPYAYTGPTGSLGLGFVTAFDDTEVRFLSSFGWRAGGGAMLRLGSVQVRLDLGAGVRDLRPEVVMSFSLGAAF